MPNEGIAIADKPYVAFKEGPATAATPLRAWFFPGERTGDEFVYSDTEANDIFNSTNVPVLTMPAPTHGHGKAKGDTNEK